MNDIDYERHMNELNHFNTFVIISRYYGKQPSWLMYIDTFTYKLKRGWVFNIVLCVMYVCMLVCIYAQEGKIKRFPYHTIKTIDKR